MIAIQFLTRLPTPHVTMSGDDFACSMRWFPAVGLIIGLCVTASVWAAVGMGAWAAALVGLTLWVGITGALHLDGLGDMADASGAAHKDGERLRAVLADPHVGSFAVVAIAMQLLAKLVLLQWLAARELYAPILLIPFAARIGPLVWTRFLPPLHAGLGARFAGVVRPIDLILWGAALLAGAWAAPALLAAPLLFAIWGMWLLRRIGGISGDGHGAGIELVESALLLTTLAIASLP